MITLYGIPNCDTVKRARKTLDSAGIIHHFHDFRRDGLSPEQAQSWLDTLGADQLINRRGTTWRQLDSTAQAQADSGQAAQLLRDHPALIKRPVIDRGDALRVGFPAKQADEIIRWLQQG